MSNLEIEIEDSYYFVHAVNLLKSLDSIVPFMFAREGFMIMMRNQKLKKDAKMTIRILYPSYDIIDYKMINIEKPATIKVDAIMFDEKTKGIKQADKLRFFTKKDSSALYYNFNDTAISEMKTYQDVIEDEPIIFPPYNEKEPVVVINKNKYVNMASDLKRLKKQYALEATIYKRGIKFTYSNYGVKTSTVSEWGIIEEKEAPRFTMSLDSQFFLFVQSKMSKLFPDKSHIRLYALEDKSAHTLILRIPVGCTGHLDVSYSVNL
jgi:hypothetical protein